MSSTLKALSLVDIKSKNIVFGFTRRHEVSSQFNIPMVIKHLCLLYYFEYNEYDRWDKNCIADDMEINDNNCLIHNCKNQYTHRSAFLEKVFESGKHRWTFKIQQIKIYNKWSTSIGHIGVFKVNSGAPPTHSYFEFDGIQGMAGITGYGFCYQFGILISGNRDLDKYGIRCKKGDIIEMIVDMNKLELKYIINGIDYGKAHCIEKTHYRAAVFFTNERRFHTIVIIQRMTQQ